jgi:hypothetical protein
MGANAVTTVPVYVAGEVLTAADLNITNSGIPVFADSTARDAAFGGTGEKVLAEGQYAYLESTDATQVYDGATWQAVGASGMTLVSATIVGSAVASVTVSSAFSATYDAYRIVITNLTTSASTGIEMTLGATVANYYYVSSAALFATGNFSNQVGEANAAKWVVMGNTGAATVSNSLDVTSPFLASRTFFSGGFISTAGGTAGVLSGYLDNTTSYTAFTVTPSSGTMTGGTIRVYGYANS